MQIIKTINQKVSAETNHKRRKKYKQVRTNFILSCGEGFLKNGRLIQDYDIHHQIPLSLKEGNSDFDNLCIISRSFHNYINAQVYEPQITSRERYCYFPKFPRVVDDKQKAELCNWLNKGRIK